MTGLAASTHRRFGFTGLAAILVLSSIVSFADERPKQVSVEKEIAVERLLEQLESDPERNTGEPYSDWYRRISLKNLAVAEKILAHPNASAEHKAAAIDRKLAALELLAKRDPDRYEERWRTFANRVVNDYPGSPMALQAASDLLNHRISDDPADPRIVSDIERFAQTYPDSTGRSYQLYFRLTALLYEHDPDRALAILDRAFASLPPDLAASLRQHKNKLTMVGGKLSMSWPKLGGGQFKMDEFRGKVVFVYSWATWCGPCIEKFPMLNELHEKYHAQGFEIVAVSQNDDPSDVVEFLKMEVPRYTHVMHSEKYREKYGPMGTPDSLLIDRNGIVSAHALFGHKEIESAVKQLLEMPAEINSGLPVGTPIP